MTQDEESDETVNSEFSTKHVDRGSLDNLKLSRLQSPVRIFYSLLDNISDFNNADQCNKM